MNFFKALGLLLGLCFAAAFAMSCGDDEGSPAAADPDHEGHSAALQTSSFHDGMRMLWEDHIAWTRLAIISIAADLPDSASTTARLLENRIDIGDAIKPYYGEAAGEQLTALLQEHIVIAADLVSAAGSGDEPATEQARAKWYVNADDIGAFLASANPEAWDEGEMKSMMREHLDLTLQEAVHYLMGDYEASIVDYDKIHGQILYMADMLSSGIVSQFPDRFAPTGRAP